MSNIEISTSQFSGLTQEEVLKSRAKHGANVIQGRDRYRGLKLAKSIVFEPMFLLLAVACSIYFITGESSEGILMAFAILFVSGISLFQEIRSRNAISALKKLNEPHVKVIREGRTVKIPIEKLVVNDLIVVEEGRLVLADAVILQANDFTVNEAILTGEAFSIFKDSSPDQNQIFFGTIASSGSCIARVDSIGAQTALAKIGKSLENIDVVPSTLQLQINRFIKGMAVFGIAAFLAVWGLNYMMNENLTGSLLQGLTLAMSVLPEEIPVAFATFMAIGAWRLIKIKVLTKQPTTVESLGSATIICLDKTGTITKNEMRVVEVFDAISNQSFPIDQCVETSFQVLKDAMWSSEPVPFDPMEKAIHAAYGQFILPDARPNYRMIHEYPLAGSPPMMTHIYENSSRDRIIAAKGGLESLLEASNLDESHRALFRNRANDFARKGYRVLATAHAAFTENDFPDNQQEFHWKLSGLIALEDPPKENINKVLQQFYRAGLGVKMITGDYPETALAIARQSGFKLIDSGHLSGSEVMKLSDQELIQKARTVDIFARVFPEAKLKIIQALKKGGEVVAMTGDGVNDGPALKAADIGVAMGERGTEIAQRAASMILLDDNLQRMVDAITMGRRIYENLKKAIQYIISIHIPIILIVTLPLVLGWQYPNIFSPIHVIFLELIMGPTCSIIFENEPMETGLASKAPRKKSSSLFSISELSLSIFQGLAITIGLLFIYQFGVGQGLSESVVRAMTFTTLIASNVFLTLTNRSFTASILETITYKNPLMPLIIGITITIWFTAVTLPGMRQLFDFDPINPSQALTCFLVGLLSVVWIEGYKYAKRKNRRLTVSS